MEFFIYFYNFITCEYFRVEEMEYVTVAMVTLYLKCQAVLTCFKNIYNSYKNLYT